MPKEEKHSLDKPKKYKIVISRDALLDIKSTKKYINAENQQIKSIQ